jgi:hypothetical protein
MEDNELFLLVKFGYSTRGIAFLVYFFCEGFCMRLFLVRALCAVESMNFLFKRNKIQLLYSYSYNIFVGGKFRDLAILLLFLVLEIW